MPNPILLYENYKEPLRPIDGGFGFYGTLAMTRDKAAVQCHICGRLFSMLGPHLWRSHQLKATAYRETYQLDKGTSLISDELRRKKQMNVVNRQNFGIVPLAAYNQEIAQGSRPTPATGHGYSLEHRNKRGLCPDQVLEKIRELGLELKRAPTYKEFETAYNGRYISSIKYLHGSYTAAVRKLGWQTAGDLRYTSKDKLIAELQTFHAQYGRIPMTSDFKRGLLRPLQTYIRHFGTLNMARIEAGMNAVLPLARGSSVELTPDQYMDYLSLRTSTRGNVSQKQLALAGVTV